MPRTTKPDPTRARLACDTCRRKKTKCPGEQPVCSLCQRLKQSCSYTDPPINRPTINRGRGGTRSERGNPEDRLQRLELHIEQIYGILNGIDPNFHQNAREAPSLLNDAEDRHDSASSAGITVDTTEATMIPSHYDEQSRTWNFDQSTITLAAKVYISKIHCQPLPLFETFGLEFSVAGWPQHLLLSFVVIASRLSPDVMPRWSAEERRDCRREARREVMIKVAENDSHLETLQSFCLLILEEIAEQDKHAVWLDIGIGARLATINNPPLSSRRKSEWARACWSLYVLDHIYNSGFSTARVFPEDFDLCDYPQSHPLPETRSLPVTSDVRFGSHSAKSKSAAHTDIDACCLSLLSVWSHAMTFLRDVRDNNDSIVWSEHGGYQKVLTKLYQFEISIGKPHRLRNARVDERSSLQLEAERGYWASWLTMQFLYHAIQATINHPFLHIAERHKNRSARPPSFLQHTVDQMLLHSSWVTKFIDLCEDKDFTINDPFVAHLVSIVASGYMFFLNNSDPRIAGQAQRGFDTCYGFIRRSAVVWTHLTDTIRKLDILKRPNGNQSSANDTTLARPVQASLLWSLFDYSSSTTSVSISTDPAAAIDLNVTTQLLPLPNSIRTPRTEHSRNSEATPTANITTDQDPFEQTNTTPNDMGGEANIFDSFMDSEIYGLNLEGDFWTELGQL